MALVVLIFWALVIRLDIMSTQRIYMWGEKRYPCVIPLLWEKMFDCRMTIDEDGERNYDDTVHDGLVCGPSY